MRELKQYSDEIKLSIYEKLSQQSLRFDDLVEASGRNRVTLSEYLTHAQKVGEAERDPGTKEYRLTAKGGDEFDQLVTKRKMADAAVRYTGQVDSLRELMDIEAPIYFDGLGGGGSLMLPENLPLPVSVNTSIYGTKEIGFFWQLAEDAFDSRRGDSQFMEPGPVYDKLARKAVRTDLTGPIAKRVLWDAIMQRIWYLIGLHKNYAEGHAKPPPFDLESILGFDLSLTMRYEGKALMEEPEPVKHKAARRLVGVMLLRAGSGNYESIGGSVGTYDLVDFFDRAGLLDRSDVDRVRRGFRKLGYKRARVGKDGRISGGGGSSKTGMDKEGRKLVLEVAIRYLTEGGVLELADGMTAKMLAKLAVGEKWSKRELSEYGT